MEIQAKNCEMSAGTMTLTLITNVSWQKSLGHTEWPSDKASMKSRVILWRYRGLKSICQLWLLNDFFYCRMTWQLNQAYQGNHAGRKTSDVRVRVMELWAWNTFKTALRMTVMPVIDDSFQMSHLVIMTYHLRKHERHPGSSSDVSEVLIVL